MPHPLGQLLADKHGARKTILNISAAQRMMMRAGISIKSGPPNVLRCTSAEENRAPRTNGRTRDNEVESDEKSIASSLSRDAPQRGTTRLASVAFEDTAPRIRLRPASSVFTLSKDQSPRLRRTSRSTPYGETSPQRARATRAPATDCRRRASPRAGGRDDARRPAFPSSHRLRRDTRLRSSRRCSPRRRERRRGSPRRKRSRGRRSRRRRTRSRDRASRHSTPREGSPKGRDEISDSRGRTDVQSRRRLTSCEESTTISDSEVGAEGGRPEPEAEADLSSLQSIDGDMLDMDLDASSPGESGRVSVEALRSGLDSLLSDLDTNEPNVVEIELDFSDKDELELSVDGELVEVEGADEGEIELDEQLDEGECEVELDKAQQYEGEIDLDEEQLCDELELD